MIKIKFKMIYIISRVCCSCFLVPLGECGLFRGVVTRWLLCLCDVAASFS
jgi:hypothetical protein